MQMLTGYYEVYNGINHYNNSDGYGLQLWELGNDEKNAPCEMLFKSKHQLKQIFNKPVTEIDYSDMIDLQGKFWYNPKYAQHTAEEIEELDLLYEIQFDFTELTVKEYKNAIEKEIIFWED